MTSKRQLQLIAAVMLFSATSMSVACSQPQTVPKPPPNSSMTCQFDAGPLAGQTRDFSRVPGAAAFAVGAPCTDGKDSFGVAIADRTTPAPSEPPTAAVTADGASRAAALRCRFTSGPRAGQAQDLVRDVGAPPAVRGRPCDDGKGSRGVAQ